MSEESKKVAFKYEDKIISREDAAKRVEELKAQGLKVGWTNGAFDLIHSGHLYSIREIKSNCDFLIVGVNSDTSVQAIKGPTRPIQDENTRAEILASLEMIDMVVMFDEPSVEKTIYTVKPNVLLKGEEYRDKDIPEKHFLKEHGGEMIFLKLKAGCSTSNTVAKIKAAEEAEKQGDFERPDFVS